MSFEYHGITIWVFIFWFVLIPVLLGGLLVLIDRKYRENTKSYKSNANPLSLNESSDKEDG